MEETKQIEFFQCTLDQYNNRDDLEPKELDSIDADSDNLETNK